MDNTAQATRSADLESAETGGRDPGARGLISRQTGAGPGLGPAANRLLAAMPDSEFQLLAPQLKLVELTLGQVISEPEDELEYAYFPLNSIVSLLYVMDNGESAEIGLVGNDGMLGVTLFMGGNSTTIRAVVQSAGQAYRLPAHELIAAVARGGATLRLLLLYTQSLMTQMTQTAACNRHHTLNQQFSRWLLLSFDRLGGRDMVMTQELIAKMLGVNAESVTAAAQALGAEGAIAYSGGRISLLNRACLEQTSCECYQVVKHECDRLMPPVLPHDGAIPSATTFPAAEAAATAPAEVIDAADAEALPTSFGVFKPVGHVMMGLPTQALLDALAAALQGAGWPASGVRQFAPQDSAAEMQGLVDQAGTLAGFGSEITLLRRYLSLTEAGYRWLLVQADDSQQATAAADIARAGGATLAVYYRRLVVEELIP